jgi:sulfur carrier protein ThiS
MSPTSFIPRLAAALLSATGNPASAADLPAFVGTIAAGTIAVVSDGDFVGQSYATGQLAPREGGHRDLLTVLSIVSGKVTRAQIPVSNSVTAAPEILALAPDGNTAFVIERLSERPEGGDQVRDLAPGRRLFAIDLSTRASPQIAASAEIEVFPEALSLSPDGARIAVVSNMPAASVIQILSYRDGHFGGISRFNLADLGITGSAPGPRGGVTASNVHWHPSGRFLAVNINSQNRIAFFEVTESEGGLNLRPWGNIVEVGRDPFVGRFTPDGRFYVTSDWGRDLRATTLEGRIPRAPSGISVIRLADPGADPASARHARVATATTDASAEGLAISRDGRLVATVNMRDTAFPPTSPRFQREATVTLLTFDPQTGVVEKVADYPFEGVLPEGGTFDLTGDHLLVTVFHGHQDAEPNAGAGIEVFRVVRGERPALVRVGRIPTPHGAHHVDIAR